MLSNDISKQSTIVFEPLSIETNFEKEFCFQLAFYRNDKVKKIQPIKLSQPQKLISLNKTQSLLRLHTLLNVSQKNDSCQSKIFKLQIVYKIDGKKDNIDKEIDIANYYKKSNQILTLKICSKPQTQLKYRILIKTKYEQQRVMNGQSIQKNMQSNHNFLTIQQDYDINNFNDYKSKNSQVDSMKSIPKAILTNKSIGKLGDQQKVYERSRKKNNTVRIRQSNEQKSPIKIKTYNFLPKDGNQFTSMNHIPSSKNIKDDKNISESKIQLLEMELDLKTKQINQITNKYNQLQFKFKDAGHKYQKMVDKCKQYEKSKENAPSSSQKAEKLEKSEKLEKLEKQLAKAKQSLKQFQLKHSTRQKQFHDITIQKKRYQNQIKQLKQQSQHFQQLYISSQSKLPNLQQSLKPYKQRIKHLQKRLQDLQQQKNFTQTQLKKKNQQLYETKQKIKSKNQENLKLLQDFHNKEYQIQKLNKKIKEIQLNKIKSRKSSICSSQGESDQQQNNRKNTFKSQKVVGQVTASKLKTQNIQLKAKLAIALKNLENKELLLKKFDAFSQQQKKQLYMQIQELKKQNIELQSTKSSSKTSKSQLSSLESKMQLQRLKKDIEYKTKSQRQHLIDKSQLQSRNKTLQDDIIRSKQSIANILNAIHQFGDQGLIQDVTSCL